ncbi:MAG: hypothetical protein JJE04_17970 [Acidobacteriia bacterium]|nr:hypothetical protein [Terriglobia bacterium]
MLDLTAAKMGTRGWRIRRNTAGPASEGFLAGLRRMDSVTEPHRPAKVIYPNGQELRQRREGTGKGSGKVTARDSW